MVPKIGTKIESRGPGFPGPRDPELVPEFGTILVPKIGTKVETREPIFRALAFNFSCPAGKKTAPKTGTKMVPTTGTKMNPAGQVFLALATQNWFQNLEPKWFQKLAPQSSLANQRASEQDHQSGEFCLEVVSNSQSFKRNQKNALGVKIVVFCPTGWPTENVNEATLRRTICHSRALPVLRNQNGSKNWNQN